MNCDQKHDGKCIDVIYGKKGGSVEIQALRYPKGSWTAASAGSHCKSRGGKFEAAKEVEMITEKSTRFYSTLEVKSFDDELRIIEGIATTPAPDRDGDVVFPKGINFKLPLPFLYQHNAREPIGNVLDAKVTDNGLAVKVKIADKGIDEDADKAWGKIKSGLVRGLSIGFRSIKEAYDKARSGFDFLETELLEVSAVTIPANAEAAITSIKNIQDIATEELAAIGNKARPVVSFLPNKNQPGASGISITGGKMRTLEEQIAALEAKRQANVARQEAIRTKKAEEGSLMDESETEEFDTLSVEIEAIDGELVRLRRHQQQVKKATPISEDEGKSSDGAPKLRTGIITVKAPEVPKGTALTRFAMVMLASKGDRQLAYDMARANKRWKDSTPQVEKFLSNPQAFMMVKDTASAGDTSTSGFASQIADYTWMASEFIEYLRPMTVIGRIPTLRRVPFNIKVPTQSAGSTVNWVGEGLAKPVTGLTLSTATLRFAKVSGIIVLTEELVRFSNPSAEALVRADLAAQIVQFLDEQFLDATVTAVANVNPASITNGAGTAAASGGTAADFRYDLQLAITQMVNANIDVSGVYIVMQPALALAMSLMRNDLGGKEFPDLTVNGGTLEGFTCITSNSGPSGQITFLQPSEVMLADDGGIALDVSREATVTMDDGTSPTVTTSVNLWQNNLVGLRAEREITWARRRDAAVYYISSAAYTEASP